MRKILAFMLTLILSASLFVGCGIVSTNDPVTPAPPVTDPDNPSNSDNPENPNNPDVPSTPDEPSETAFTVHLVYGEQPYIPDAESGISAVWTGETGGDIHTAPFNEEGVASIEGLDGDYRVTLSALPDGITYNANAYRATNDGRDVTVELERLVRVSTLGNKGSSVWNPINISADSGVYRINITKAGETVYCQYAPPYEGRYSIESWADATTNEVNPFFDEIIYSLGTVIGTVDDGGYSSTFTKNFKYTMNVDTEAVGRSYRFAVRAESRTGEYPVNVDIIVRRERQADSEAIPYDIVFPEEDFEARQEEFARSGVAWTPSAIGYSYVSFCNEYGILEGSRVKLNPADGLYHLYNEKTGEYNEILYTKITSNIPITINRVTFDFWLEERDSFATIEDHGNKALTVYDKSIGRARAYELFIMGTRLTGPDGTGDVRFIGHDNEVGYFDFVNEDGAYPVTAELKQFLQEFALSQRYFDDGNGYAEECGLKAAEGNEWLFACGYYNGYIPS